MARVGRSRQASEQAAYEASLHLDGAAPLLDLDDEDGDLLSQVCSHLSPPLAWTFMSACLS